ncbi:MAG: hypothetical protein HFH41_14460, partial [Lachnospiraceae bacterium]|nr:hypothetical protein [Lachnospiraceae bacterium]
MAIKIKFDVARTPEFPTLVLARRDGSKIGMLTPSEVNLRGCLNDADEIQFKIYKEADGVECPFWDDLVNFKLIWCKEWNAWFSITVELDETNPKQIVKDVNCIALGESELSQIMLYTIEINTEDDIARDDYKVATLYNGEDHEASLIHRITEKAPHYQLKHVDSTIANIQRTFTFDGTSIYDAFQEIAEEIGCLFVLDCYSDSNGNLQRTISIYDLETNCNACGHRGEFSYTCPECGSKDLNYGYGEDTTIFVSSDALGDEIQFETDTDSVKNCFRLEAGDDLMT